KSCTAPAGQFPSRCENDRPVNVCCTWVEAPSTHLARSANLHVYSSSDPTLNLSCNTEPKPLGTSKTVTVTGHVQLLAGGSDSVGVKIEIFKEGPNGTVGDLIGSPVVTAKSVPTVDHDPTWSTYCPCAYRAYSYDGVPTETPVIVKTSDANP